MRDIHNFTSLLDGCPDPLNSRTYLIETLKFKDRWAWPHSDLAPYANTVPRSPRGEGRESYSVRALQITRLHVYWLHVYFVAHPIWGHWSLTMASCSRRSAHHIYVGQIGSPHLPGPCEATGHCPSYRRRPTAQSSILIIMASRLLMATSKHPVYTGGQSRTASRRDS